MGMPDPDQERGESSSNDLMLSDLTPNTSTSLTHPLAPSQYVRGTQLIAGHFKIVVRQLRAWLGHSVVVLSLAIVSWVPRARGSAYLEDSVELGSEHNVSAVERGVGGSKEEGEEGWKR